MLFVGSINSPPYLTSAKISIILGLSKPDMCYKSIFYKN